MLECLLQFDDGLVSLGLGFVALLQRRPEFEQVFSQLELRLDLAAERQKRVLLTGGQLPRHHVNHTQSTQRKTVGTLERSAGVETNFGLRNNKRVRTEPGILGCVGDDKQVRLLNGPVAKRKFARSFAQFYTDVRLEPLALGVDQRDQRNRRFTDVRCENGEIVKRLFGIGIENLIAAQRPQAPLLVFHWDLPAQRCPNVCTRMDGINFLRLNHLPLEVVEFGKTGKIALISREQANAQPCGTYRDQCVIGQTPPSNVFVVIAAT